MVYGLYRTLPRTIHVLFVYALRCYYIVMWCHYIVMWWFDRCIAVFRVCTFWVDPYSIKENLDLCNCTRVCVALCISWQRCFERDAVGDSVLRCRFYGASYDFIWFHMISYGVSYKMCPFIWTTFVAVAPSFVISSDMSWFGEAQECRQEWVCFVWYMFVAWNVFISLEHFIQFLPISGSVRPGRV